VPRQSSPPPPPTAVPSPAPHSANASADRDHARFLEQKFRLAEDVDAVLEHCLTERKDLAGAVQVVFACLGRHLHPAMAFVRTFNEDLAMALFCHGILPELLQQSHPDLLTTAAPCIERSPGLVWYAIPLDMAGETVGSMGVAFPAAGKPLEDELLFELLNVVAEELDGFLYGIQENRRRHAFLMKIQKILESRLLPEAIQAAMTILVQTLAIKELLLLYIDEDLGGKPTLHHVVFRDNQMLFDSHSAPLPPLQSLTIEVLDGLPEQSEWISEIFSGEGVPESHPIWGLRPGERIGLLMAVSPDGGSFSITNREVLQVFTECVRHRLIDFNREKNLLRQFFSAGATRDLLRKRNYFDHYLVPRQATIGFLVADITGFCDALQTRWHEPAVLADLVFRWSSGCRDVIFECGGAVEPMVGDRITGLFGPPFYEDPPAGFIPRMMKAALGIRDLARTFFAPEIVSSTTAPAPAAARPGKPRMASIGPKGSPTAETLGVTVSLHLAPSIVGLFGPTRHLTALGEGMREALWLCRQGVCDDILVSDAVKACFEGTQWTFSGPYFREDDHYDGSLPVLFRLRG
jgi:class 3 adenylate cyclase